MYEYGETLSLMIAVVCVPYIVCLSVKTSKACYGVQGLPCTKHTMGCSSGKIAIQDAYYTNSTACPLDGLSNCNVSVSSISDTGRYIDFSETQWIDLYKNCSTKSNCAFNGGRKYEIATFTVLKYICITVKTSKACYGSQGLSCTKHTLECSSGMIGIQDAYYTNSTACPVVGLSNCNINVSSIPDTGRYQDFSETQLVNLYKICSNKFRCTFNVGRRTARVAFSVVKFICIKDHSNVSGNTCTASQKSASYEFPGDMFVAGIFTGAVVLLMSGFLIYFLFIRRRFDLIKKQDAVPASATHPTYAGLSGPQQTDNYDVIKRQSQSQTSQPSLYENVAKTP